LVTEEGRFLAEKVALLFPGQGSQFVGMGRDLFEDSAAVREVYERASEAISVDLAAISFEGPEDELRKTVNTQPALLTASVAALTLLTERGLTPWAAAGHSLGEYTALVAARSLSLEDAVRAVRERGRLMYEAGLATPGTMAAVIGLSEEQLAAVLAEASKAGVVAAANLNAPGQIVISGAVDAVKNAMAGATAAGAKRVIELKVSGAFHSSLLSPARDGMGAFLAGTAIARPRCLFVANVSGATVEDPEEIRRNLVAQIVSPVRWVDCFRTLVARGATLMVEAGPGNVLRGLSRRIDPNVRTMGAGTLEEIDRLLAALPAS
jgi:[acyl-carrier-protein] S-malonyltransferase